MLKYYFFIFLILPFFSYAVDKELINDTSLKIMDDYYKKSLQPQEITDEDLEEHRKRYFPICDAGKSVHFMLYTRDSISYEELFIGNKTSIKQSKFDKSKETKIIVHGWFSKGHMRFSRDIRKAYLQAKDCNVISVDWPSMTLYIIARLRVDSVAKKLSEFLKFLINDVEVDPKSIHLLGHSLGAHVVGIAGSSLENKLPRITGFDPAGVYFSSKPEYRIDASDAQFVDIVHTCGHWLGYFDPVGHVDFYPNGGVPIQPGCGLDFGYCTHCRSYILYAEAITRSESVFLAAKCGNYSDFIDEKCCSDIIEMGENVDRKARGTYFLFTGDKMPYALGKQSIPEKCWNQSATILS